jgi:hypothetical protein
LFIKTGGLEYEPMRHGTAIAPFQRQDRSNAMFILICATAPTAAGRRLQEHLRTSAHVERCDLFTSVAAFGARLRRPLGTATIGILIPADDRDLVRLAASRHLLRDMRIILVLPDSLPQTISNGHTLRPRFVSYADGDLKDVQAVVEKMVCTHAACTAQAI